MVGVQFTVATGLASVTTQAAKESDELEPEGTEIEVTADEAREARRRMTMLSAGFFLLFMGAGAQQLYIAPYLKDCTDWTDLMRGIVVATVYASMMVFRVLNVYLLRGWTYWRLTFVGSLTYALFTIALLGVHYLPSFWLMLVAAAVWGWGAAAMWTGSTMQVLEAADRGKQYGLSNGILYGATHAGWLVGAAVLGIIYEQPGWPAYTMCLAAMVITMAGNVLVYLVPLGAGAFAPNPSLRELAEVMSRAKVRIASFLLTTSSLAFGFMLGVFADHVKTQYGEEYIWMTAVLYPGGKMILSIVGGALADRIGHGVTMAVGFISAAAGMWLAAQWDSVFAVGLAALALSLLNGTVPVVASAMVGDSADRSRRPVAYGALFSFRDLGVVIAAVWGKILMAGEGGFVETFNTFAVVFVLCGVAAAFMGRYTRERL